MSQTGRYCDFCSIDNCAEATMFCLKCDKYLCTRCLNHHMEVSDLRLHNYIPSKSVSDYFKQRKNEKNDNNNKNSSVEDGSKIISADMFKKIMLKKQWILWSSKKLTIISIILAVVALLSSILVIQFANLYPSSSKEGQESLQNTPPVTNDDSSSKSTMTNNVNKEITQHKKTVINEKKTRMSTSFDNEKLQDSTINSEENIKITNIAKGNTPTVLKPGNRGDKPHGSGFKSPSAKSNSQTYRKKTVSQSTKYGIPKSKSQFSGRSNPSKNEEVVSVTNIIVSLIVVIAVISIVVFTVFSIFIWLYEKISAFCIEIFEYLNQTQNPAPHQTPNQNANTALMSIPNLMHTQKPAPHQTPNQNPNTALISIPNPVCAQTFNAGSIRRMPHDFRNMIRRITEIKTLYFLTADPYRLGVVNNNIWIRHGAISTGQVAVYNLQLEKIKEYKWKEIKEINTVQQVNDNDVLVLTSQGIHVVDTEGRYRYKVIFLPGTFTDVSVSPFSNDVAVIECKENKICFLEYTVQHWWKENKEIKVNETDDGIKTIQFTICNDIAVSLQNSNKIIVVDIDKEEVSYSYHAKAFLSMFKADFNGPLVCGIDAQCHLVVCDMTKHKFQVCHATEGWQQIRTEINQPRDVLVINNDMYLLHGYDGIVQLTKYQIV